MLADSRAFFNQAYITARDECMVEGSAALEQQALKNLLLGLNLRVNKRFFSSLLSRGVPGLGTTYIPCSVCFQ